MKFVGILTDGSLVRTTGIDWRKDISSFPKYYIYFMLCFVGNALKCQFSCLQSENSSGCGILGNETTYPHLLTLTIKMEARKFSGNIVTAYKITQFNETKITI
jgi:hypothetical protein